MPFILVTVGLIVFLTAINGTFGAFGNQLKADLTGPGNFTWWIAAVFVVGALGYIPTLEKFSRAFLALIIIGIVLANQGLFTKLTAALQNGPTAPTTSTSASNSVGASTQTAGTIQTPIGPINQAQATQAATDAFHLGETALTIAATL